MNKKVLLLIVPILLVASCTPKKNQENSQKDSNFSSISSEINDSEAKTSINNSSDNISYNDSVSEIPEEEYEQYVPEAKYSHYLTMGLPKNHDNPEELLTSTTQQGWSNNIFNQALPDGFRYAYNNSYDDGEPGHKASPDYYSEQDGGGLKLSKVGWGFQSKEFRHTGQKLEIRIKYKLYKGSGSVNENDDTAHVYFYTSSGALVGQYNIAKGSFNAKEKTEATYTFYWTGNASKVAYFEFRLLAFPFKGSQNFNTQVMECNIKSWERA